MSATSYAARMRAGFGGRLMAVLVMVSTGCGSTGQADSGRSAESTVTSANSPPTEATSASPPSPSAQVAVTVTPYLVAGWWDGQTWVVADGTRPVPVSGGERYSIVGLTGPVTTGSGSAAGPGCETDPGTSTIAVSGLDRDGDGPRPRPIAVSGVADPRPKPTTVLDPASPVYREAAGATLAEWGVDDQDADVVQALRADVDGDGTDEVVVVAERIADRDGLYARPGDYSFVLLRRVVNEAVVTGVMAHSLPDPTPGATPFIYSHRVAAIADLNGDGRMELVLELRQYEGVGVAVHELRRDGSTPAVLENDCGA